MSNSSLLGPARDSASHGEFAVHDHACGIYDSHAEEYGPAVRFLKAGLNRKEQCLYIAEHLTPAEFMSLLKKDGVNVKEATTSGSLLVLSGKEVRRHLGGFTPARMLTYLGELEGAAMKAGFTALRLCADMTWLRQDNIESTEFFQYEAELNLLLSQINVVGLCQFAMDDFRSELLIAAAETHPLLVFNKSVYDNFYYIPPEEYLKPGFSDMKFKRMLYNVTSRERLMQKFLLD